MAHKRATNHTSRGERLDCEGQDLTAPLGLEGKEHSISDRDTSKWVYGCVSLYKVTVWRTGGTPDACVLRLAADDLSEDGLRVMLSFVLVSLTRDSSSRRAFDQIDPLGKLR